MQFVFADHRLDIERRELYRGREQIEEELQQSIGHLLTGRQPGTRAAEKGALVENLVWKEVRS